MSVLSRHEDDTDVERFTNQHINIDIRNRFLVDFGFVCGPVSKVKSKGNLISSFDGCTSYLLVTDKSSRYTWVFLTKYQNPPIEIVDTFLEHRGLKKGMRIIRTYQEGELAKSSEFRKLLNKYHYTLDITGSDASFQNGMAEQKHRIYNEMTRTMLMTAKLSNIY